MSKKYTLLALVLVLGAGIVLAGAGCETTTTESDSDEFANVTTTETDGEMIVSDTNTYEDVTPEQAKALIEERSGLVILDVSNAYAQGHIPGAINYYVGDGSLDEAIPDLEKNVPYLVYCHVDSASISGAEKLIAAGFPEVYRLEGNYSAWVDAGYEVEK